MTGRALTGHPNQALRRLWFPDGVANANMTYRICCSTLRWLASVSGVRVFNRHVEPTAGGVLYICNHQSFFDPVLMGCTLRRPVNFMARDSLFSNPAFGKLIWRVNAFPVRRGAADMTAIKEGIRRIRAGGQLAVFPEGTRTTDGRIGKFLPGVTLLARRTGATIVPVLIDGAYECWPRSRPLPTPGRIVVQYGTPIPGDQVRSTKPEILITRIRDELIAIQTDVRRRVGRPPIRYND